MACFLYAVFINFLRNVHGEPMYARLFKKSIPFLFLFLFLTLNAQVEVRASLRRNAVVNAVEKATPAVVNISTVDKERVGVQLTFPPDWRVEDFHLQVSAPCRAHHKKSPPQSEGLLK